ncbi:uncharacterized protein LOC103482551 [Cucumis melo]|uniref:Uncharacterized protein LOC103482551 n=1 Tax=Cucumis melo TaxID=3656 RepID=A0A1S3AT34_CUCME|nr:uncharacterized protein LOC103482551 [Cucumis melo]
MQCALVRSSDFQKVLDKGKESLDLRLEKNSCSRGISKDFEVSSFAWRNFFDYRCAVIRFLTLESDGLWRIVALPPQYLDSLNVSCLPQMNQFTAGRKLVQKGSASNGTYSFNSLRCRSLLESNKKLLDSKAIKSPNKSSGKLLCTSSCSASALMSSDSIATSDIPIDGAKMQRYGKKNPRKKAKKKELEYKKISSEFVSAETEVSLQDSARASFLSEACGSNDSDFRNRTVLCSIAPETFLPDFERDSEIQPLGTVDSVSSEIVDGHSSKVSSSAIKNFSGYHKVCGSENQALTNAPGCFHVDVGLNSRESLLAGSCNDFCSTDSLDNNSCDSKWVSLNSNCDDLNLKLNEKKGFGVDLLEERSSPYRENCSQNSARDEVHLNTEVEKGIQGCTVSETCSVLPGKKTKQNKKLTGSSRMNRYGGLGSSQRRTGKENRHTVWQKVQRSNSGGCSEQLDQVSPISKQFKGICNPVAGVQMPKVKDKKTGNRKQLKEKCSRRLKRKNTSGQEKIYRPTRNSCGSNTSSMVHKPPNERLDIRSMGFDIRRSSGNPRSRFQNDTTDKCMNSEAVEGKQVHPDELFSNKLIYDGLSSQKVENDSSSLPKSCNSSNQSNPVEVKSPVYLPHLFFQKVENDSSSLPKSCNSSNLSNPVEVKSPVYLPHLFFQKVENDSSSLPKSCNSSNLSNTVEVKSPVYLPHLFFQATKGSSLAERSKHETQSRSPLQNWLPSGAEGSRSTTLARPDFSSLRDANTQPAEFGTSEKSIKERVNCSLLNPVSDVLEGIQHYRDRDHGSLEHECEVQKIYGFDTTTLQNQKCEFDVDEHFNCKSSCEDVSRMEQAVNNACKAQLASEAIQMETGCPIAEFERFLHLSSPVIDQRPKLRSSEICPRNLPGDVIPCSNETTNISLACLWQWYEKHGSYGLEIKAKSHENSNGFGVVNSAFRAYFVPFLSAIQLFKSRKTHVGTTTGPLGFDSCVSDIKVKEPSTCHLPIFSLLFPEPSTDDTSVLRVCNRFHSSEQDLASEKRKSSKQSASLQLSGESELIFEYFEGEQPQLRRPLFDKIHQLVEGDGCLQGKIYGDPTMLNSITLDDLHAGSWYSVAWYPIYRIPDGNLRAAFLTYHSLGHFVSRTSQDTNSCLVCPVVGLQSYNAQNECWFEPRESTSTFTSDLNPPRVLQERLRTLEETASLMARAVVKKGNLNSGNTHPDYEFFLSRRF